jgi:hypothetical protein
MRFFIHFRGKGEHVKRNDFFYNSSKEYLDSISSSIYNEITEVITKLPKRQKQELNSTYSYFHLVHLCSSSAYHEFSFQAKFENQGQPLEWCINRTV